MAETEVTMKMPLYMDVLSKLPGVTDADIEETEDVIRHAFTKMPKELVFNRGKQGDGRIWAPRYWYDYKYIAHMYFYQDGKVVEEAKQYEGQLPESIALYFFGGIFGKDEVKGEVKESDAKIIQGVRDLYECAVAKGSVEYCEIPKW